MDLRLVTTPIVDSSSSDTDSHVESLSSCQPGRKKAQVWKNFTVIKEANVSYAKCSICFNKIKYSGGSTSGMIQHIRRLHPEVNSDVPPKLKRASYKHADDVISDYIKTLDSATSQCILEDGLSLGTFEKPGMKKFLKVAVPGWTGINRNEVLRYLQNEYQTKRRSLQKTLSKIPILAVAINFTSSTFVNVNIHFRNGHESTLQNVNLGLKNFKGNQSKEKVVCFVQRILKSYEIENKVYSIVSNHEIGIEKAFPFLNAPIKCLRCMASLLQTAVSDALKLCSKESQAYIEITQDSDEDFLLDEEFHYENDCSLVFLSSSPIHESDLSSVDIFLSGLAKVRSICNFIAKSSQLRTALDVRLKSLDVSMKIPILDSKTQWTSTKMMIHDYICISDQITDAVNDVLAENFEESLRKGSQILTPNEYTALKEVNLLLTPFYQASLLMCSSEYPTSPLAITLLKGMNHSCSPSIDDSKLIKILKYRLTDQISKHFYEDGDISHELFQIYGPATYLHPKYFKSLSEVERSTVRTSLQSQLPHLSNAAHQIGLFQKTESPLRTEGGEPQSSEMDKFLENVGLKLTATSNSECVMDELTKYCNIINHGAFSSEDNPLKFWDTYIQELPLLFLLAEKYFITPLTSGNNKQIV